jgi:hypothetical protein
VSLRIRNKIQNVFTGTKNISQKNFTGKISTKFLSSLLCPNGLEALKYARNAGLILTKFLVIGPPPPPTILRYLQESSRSLHSRAESPGAITEQMRQSWDAMRTFTSFALLSSGKTDLPFV